MCFDLFMGSPFKIQKRSIRCLSEFQVAFFLSVSECEFPSECERELEEGNSTALFIPFKEK